jgi:hypothetical protein
MCEVVWSLVLHLRHLELVVLGVGERPPELLAHFQVGAGEVKAVLGGTQARARYVDPTPVEPGGGGGGGQVQLPGHGDVEAGSLLPDHVLHWNLELGE